VAQSVLVLLSDVRIPTELERHRQMKLQIDRRVTFLIVILASVALITACGGGKEEPTPAPAVEAEAAATPMYMGDAEKGQQVYTSTCTACHGPEGKGVEGLGKDMTTSEFIAGLSDAELLDFLNTGRDPGDPLNTTGVLMPPKGGNPALSDEQLLDVIVFMRSIQE
jgi:cytochrome c5